MILFLALLAESQSSLWDGAPPGVCPSVRPSVYVLKQFGFCEITQTNLDGFQGNLEHEFILSISRISSIMSKIHSV